jgi:hypothetical protein
MNSTNFWEATCEIPGGSAGDIGERTAKLS